MRAYSVVMALHIMAVAAAFFLAGGVHLIGSLSRRAADIAELRRLRRGLRLGVLFGPVDAAILGLGLFLLSMQDAVGFHLSQAWIWTAVAALVVNILDGPLLTHRHGRRLDGMIAAAPDGPVPQEVRDQLTAVVPAAVAYANTFLMLATILNMVAKPSTGLAIAVVLVGGGVGALTGAWIVSSPPTRWPGSTP